MAWIFADQGPPGITGAAQSPGTAGPSGSTWRLWRLSPDQLPSDPAPPTPAKTFWRFAAHFRPRSAPGSHAAPEIHRTALQKGGGRRSGASAGVTQPALWIARMRRPPLGEQPHFKADGRSETGPAAHLRRLHRRRGGCASSLRQSTSKMRLSECVGYVDRSLITSARVGSMPYLLIAQRARMAQRGLRCSVRPRDPFKSRLSNCQSRSPAEL